MTRPRHIKPCTTETGEDMKTPKTQDNTARSPHYETAIHIDCEGPFSFHEANKFNKPTDMGLYQIYGTHRVYGPNTLLSIGQVQDRLFAERLTEHKTRYEGYNDFSEIKFYLGYFYCKNDISKDAWKDQVNDAEKLLIYAHTPALNSQYLNYEGFPEDLRNDLIIYNWRNNAKLQDVVCAFRYYYKDNEDMEGYSVYPSKVSNS